MPDLRLRPFHDLSGALFRREAGWAVPASYGPVDSEVLAVRSGAGVIDFGDRAKVRVTGEDRTTFLDGLVTADVAALAPGRSAYALVLTDKSRVVGDLRVHALDDAYVLDVDPAQRDAVLAYIQRFLVSDDVTLQDLGPCGHLEVHGPGAARILSRAIGTELQGLLPDASVPFRIDRRREGIAARVGGTGELGIAAWAAGAGLEDLWSRLVSLGVPPVGRDAYEILRIEAGVPRVGADMGEDTLALEVAPEGAISFTKGCYVGQEVVARGTYRGHMNRRRMGLRLDGDVPPVRGDPVRTLEKDVGYVTSGAWSPTLDRVIALAILRVEDVSLGTDLFVDRGGWTLRAGLHALPFVRGRA